MNFTVMLIAALRNKMLMARYCLLSAVYGLVLISLAAAAQDRPELPRIVVFSLSAPVDHVQAFEQGPQDLGHINGSTVSIKHYSAQGREDELAALAQEAVALKPKVIAAVGAKAARAVQHATSDIPIVVVTGNITVAGLVKNLARPEGNVTGLSFFNVDLRLKQFEILLELLKMALPQLNRVVALHDSFSANQVQPTAAAAESLGLELSSLALSNPPYDFDRAMVAAHDMNAQALVVLSSPAFFGQRKQAGEATAKHKLPAMFHFGYYAKAGGLMAYGVNLPDMFRYSAAYVDKILRGANPAALPVEQPTQFELVVNLKTAEALGLTLPPSILLQATEVIE